MLIQGEILSVRMQRRRHVLKCMSTPLKMMRFILGPCLCSQRNTELAGGSIW